MIIFGMVYRYKKVEILFRASSALEKKLKNTRVLVKWTKQGSKLLKWFWILLKVDFLRPKSLLMIP